MVGQGDDRRRRATDALPPSALSKDCLKGRKTFEQILIRQESAYARETIALRLAERVVTVDRAGKNIALADGTRLAYHKLVLTTGSSPRRLSVPGVELAGVCYVRTIADIQRMLAAVRPGGQAFVIGGGHIGL